MLYKILLTSVVCVNLGACANLSPLASRKPLASKANYWLVYDSTRRGAYVFSDDGKTRVCAEPAPDAVYNFVNKLEAGVKTEGVDTSAKGELTANALALAGRDRTVLVAREMLYRICEMNANGTLPTEKVYPAFQEVAFLLKSLAEGERLRAAADVAKSLPAETRAQVLTPPK
jgi:Tfp pilus assembly protein PilZ